MTIKAFDRTQFLKGLAPEARPKKYLSRTYQFLEKTWSGLYLVDDRTLVYGSEDALVYLFDHLAGKRMSAPLDIGLQEAAQGHPVFPRHPTMPRPACRSCRKPLANCSRWVCFGNSRPNCKKPRWSGKARLFASH